ncbi:uncharacterized protein LOC141854968 isoform X2 [Brevipalpus obovatus]
MQTFPCGHRVVCRKCFVKTIQVAVSQRLLPLRCVVCRTKILRLRQTIDTVASVPSQNYLGNSSSTDNDPAQSMDQSNVENLPQTPRGYLNSNLVKTSNLSSKFGMSILQESNDSNANRGGEKQFDIVTKFEANNNVKQPSTSLIRRSATSDLTLLSIPSSTFSSSNTTKCAFHEKHFNTINRHNIDNRSQSEPSSPSSEKTSFHTGLRSSNANLYHSISSPSLSNSASMDSSTTVDSTSISVFKFPQPLSFTLPSTPSPSVTFSPSFIKNSSSSSSLVSSSSTSSRQNIQLQSRPHTYRKHRNRKSYQQRKNYQSSSYGPPRLAATMLLPINEQDEISDQEMSDDIVGDPNMIYSSEEQKTVERSINFEDLSKKADEKSTEKVLHRSIESSKIQDSTLKLSSVQVSLDGSKISPSTHISNPFSASKVSTAFFKVRSFMSISRWAIR